MKIKIIQILFIFILITMSGFACLFSPAVQGEMNPAKVNSLTSLIIGLIGLTRSSSTASSGNAATGSTGTSTGTGTGNGSTTTTGTGTTTVSAPSNLVYAGSPFTFTNGVAITTQTPTVTGTITGCAVTPSMPTGLNLNATTCAISGTPTVNQGVTSYTITASNLSGNTTVSVSITVNMAAPSSLVYAGSPFTFTNGSAIATQTPTVTGIVTSCSATPSLPIGLSITATTCAISGTPTVNQGATGYTITASNASGNTTTSISITVSSPITPIGTPTIASGSAITQTTQIVINFNRAMNTSSLSLTGLMASESSGGVWSTVTNANDKLTITATTSWTVGSSRTLTVNCNDTIGTAMTALNLSYGVLDGNVYVKTTGNDSNPGTQIQPKLTIQAAINLATSLYTAANVRVAQGTYSGSITMALNISLYGGYSSSDWNSQNISTNTTTINGSSGAGINCSISNNSFPVVIEGFTINGSSNNEGIAINQCKKPIIRFNTIKGGTGTNSWGITVSPWPSDTVTIYNNTIDAGTSTSYSFGLVIYDGIANVYNNTINGGNATNAWGIQIGYTATPRIENNIIFTSGGTTRYCIIETSSGTYPSSIKNNNLFNCPTALYLNEGISYLTTICAGNLGTAGCGTTLSLPTGSGNISVNPNFVNQAGGDYHLSASSPTSVTQGGLDLSASFTTDKDGVTRTVPWSIGAYEY